MPLKHAILGLLALTLLPSCATAPPGAAADAGRVWQFRCPPAGTTVGTSTGGTVRYIGEAGPGLCRRSDGQTAIHGIWFVPRGETPSPEVQTWLAGLFPASAGRSATAHHLGTSARNRRDSQMWLREARVVGFETLDLPPGRIDTVLIEWEDSGMLGNNHRSLYRRWLDTRTGALVRAEGRLLRGIGTEYAWHATSLSVPANAAPAADSRTEPSDWTASNRARR